MHRRVPGRVLLCWLLLVLGSTASAQDLGGFFSPGPLAEAHAELSSVTKCTQCHEPGAGVSATRCLACHDHVRGQVDAGIGFHADKGEACASCHPDHRGRDFDMVDLSTEGFDHTATGFALRGSHAEARCADCHDDTRRYQGADGACARCHDDVHGAAASTRPLLASCDRCHDEGGWGALPLPASAFDHTDPAATAYSLVGAHRDATCEGCHVDWRFVPVAHDGCAECHDDPHRARLGQGCESCHAKPVSWAVAGFDHDRTPYPLHGEHREVACATCHGQHKTRPVPHEACASCHEDPHRGRLDATPCEDCHSVSVPGFAVEDFDHVLTGTPLEHGHAEVACEDCHGSGGGARSEDLHGADCVVCHENPHQPDFTTSRCDTCHTPRGWEVDDFDHASTDFALEHAHAEASCEDCHGEQGFAALPHDSCLDCHEEHPHGDQSGGCTDCHTEVGWAEVRFDHLGATGHGLEPRHGSVACMDCHPEATAFAPVETECLACHADTRPFGHYTGTCESCHEGAGWTPATLGAVSHAITGFTIDGAHRALACEDCHASGQPYGLARPRCADCHAEDDPHRGQLGRMCADCHTTTSWFKHRWRHNQTGWPLRGPHRLAACEDCHAVGFTGTPTDCWRCHEADAPADVPAHASPGFQFCDDCHVPYTWVGPRFPH